MAISIDKVNPSFDYILVKKVDLDKTTSSGLVVSSANSNLCMGKIIKVGPGKKNPEGKLIKLDEFSVGDDVLYKKFSETDLYSLTMDKDHVMLKISDVIAFIGGR